MPELNWSAKTTKKTQRGFCCDCNYCIAAVSVQEEAEERAQGPRGGAVRGGCSDGCSVVIGCVCKRLALVW